MSEAMDQPAESPGNPKPGEGGDDSMEPGTCQELLHRLRELEVGRGPGGQQCWPEPWGRWVWVYAWGWTLLSARFARLGQS